MFLPVAGLQTRVIVLAAVCAVSLACGFAGGWKVRDPAFTKLQLRQEQQVAAAAQRALQDVAAAQDVSDSVGRASAARQVEIRTVTQEIVREVPVYVTEKSDAGCVVPRGFVRLHDAAAGGERPSAIPETAGPSHDAASGVALSTVAATVADNYGTCRADQERLSALQTWIVAQATAWDR